MSKEKVQPEVVKAVSNPFDYGYKPGSVVVLDAAVFMNTITHLLTVSREETKEQVILDTFEMEKGPALNEAGEIIQSPTKVSLIMSPMGYECEKLARVFMNIHMQNIDSGHAISLLEEPTADSPVQDTPELNLEN